MKCTIQPCCKILLIFLGALSSCAGEPGSEREASLVLEETLEQRVKESKMVFVGRVDQKVVQGDWARAVLVVEQAIANVKEGDKVEVIWRIKVGESPIYDVEEGVSRIAILKDTHEGRYWLRADRFTDLKQLDKVVEMKR